jgi:uncharacterized protein YoxC
MDNFIGEALQRVLRGVSPSEAEAVWDALQQFIDNCNDLDDEEAAKVKQLPAVAALVKRCDEAVAELAESAAEAAVESARSSEREDFHSDG